ncbi:MAG: S-layer family protein, partial [Deltaproteobacteria bacterium]|nr:S-layer family protein [Deltaproteobacteria bacterium]
NIDFTSTIGAGGALSGLSVVSAATLDFDNTVAVDDEGIDINADTVDFLNTVTTTTGGTVTIDNAGLLTIAVGANFNLDGAFIQDSSADTGTTDLDDSIVTTNDDISFAETVTLTANVAVNTGAAGGGNIQFADTLDGTVAGAQTLDLTAGTGSIDFDQQVGNGVQLGALTIHSGSGGVTAANSIDAVSMSITDGGGVDLNGAVTAPGGFASAGTTFNNTGGPITTTNNPITITHTGLVTLGGDLTSGGGNVAVTGVGVTQLAAQTINAGGGTILVDGDNGAIDLNGTLTTTSAAGNAVTVQDAGNVQLGNVNAANGTLLVGIGGDITGAVTQNAGTVLNVANMVVSTAGNVTLDNANDFTGTVSLNNTAANAMSITDVNALNFAASNMNNSTLTVNAVGITQTGGAVTNVGNAIFNGAGGAIDLTNAGNNFTGTVVLNTNAGFNAAVSDANALTLIASNVGGAMTAIAGGVLNINGDITATNGFVATSGGNTNLNANVTTTGGNVAFNSATLLGANTAVDTGPGGGNITFVGALNGTQNLDLTAGTGDVTFTGAVGGGTVLGNLMVHSSGTLTAAAITAALIDITGNTAVNLNGNVNATNTFTSRGGDFSLPGGTINTSNTDLLIANTGAVNVAGMLNAGNATAAFGSLDWASSNTSATIAGGGTVRGNTIIIGGNTVGTDAAIGNWVLQVQPASASNIFFNLGETGGVSGNVSPIGFAGADVSLDQINAAGTLTIGNVVFGANTIDFGSLLTLSSQQEMLEKLLRAAATAEFFMKAPLWIDILMEEEEEEECDPDDEECLKRKGERETSWLAPDSLRPSRLGVYRPTLLYEETEAGDLVIQLSSLN